MAITEDQTATISFLSASATHGGAPVERVDTHSAVVFLAGPTAWKLKRAVAFDYLDFSTVERRKAMCEAEVRLNRRTAPTIYRGVVPVTRTPDGALHLNGAGAPVDWLVEMQRFDQERLLDRLASKGALDTALMRPLALAIARFHSTAASQPSHGGHAGMSWVIEGNAGGLAEYGRDILDQSACARVTAATTAELHRHRALLDTRRASGYVRQCHGDLHLRNIVLLEGEPTLFDSVEFNDEIACIDVLYDLAFLIMDLWRRHLPHHANTLLNAYLAESADWGGVPLLPLFLSCRAAVRAKTSATSARMQSDPAQSTALQQSAQDYLALAERLLHPPGPCVVAIGGFSGSGKSTLARGLAPSVGGVPGAAIVRSDEVRKRLAGVSPLERLGDEGYTRAASREVYATAARLADAIVRSGHGVIVDAVFSDRTERDAIEHVAAAASVPFVGLWLDAPGTTLVERVGSRRHDASDATLEIVREQLSRGAGHITWRRIDATMPVDALVHRALECVPFTSRLEAFPRGHDN